MTVAWTTPACTDIEKTSAAGAAGVAGVFG